eukprot:6733583-Alexandrium_andersonii.AAC.1
MEVMLLDTGVQMVRATGPFLEEMRTEALWYANLLTTLDALGADDDDDGACCFCSQTTNRAEGAARQCPICRLHWHSGCAERAVDSIGSDGLSERLGSEGTRSLGHLQTLREAVLLLGYGRACGLCSCVLTQD